MSIALTEDHLAKARELVAETEAAGGLAPVDVRQFWEDNEKAVADPWADDCPQLPLGIGMSYECIFAELDLAEDWDRYYHDVAWKLSQGPRYNDISGKIVGRRLLREDDPPDPARQWPEPKGLHDIFEAENRFIENSYWLQQAASTPAELESLLDRVEKRLDGLRDFLLPAEWEREKQRLQELGVDSPIYRGQRGPVTFAMSIYGLENLVFLIMDRPDLARRFSELMARAILERARILDEERGWTPGTRQHGWSWADDNCAMLNPEMYNAFALPIMKAVYDAYAPDPNDRRGQHSDSDMAQHLPTFGELGMNSVNFGPRLTVTEIRQHLSRAVIRGQLAPFTFSRDEEINIVAETIRDAEMARERKGVVFATAGSINNGSRLTGLRLIMSAIQRYGRF